MIHMEEINTTFIQMVVSSLGEALLDFVFIFPIVCRQHTRIFTWLNGSGTGLGPDGWKISFL